MSYAYTEFEPVEQNNREQNNREQSVQQTERLKSNRNQYDTLSSTRLHFDLTLTNYHA